MIIDSFEGKKDLQYHTKVLKELVQSKRVYYQKKAVRREDNFEESFAQMVKDTEMGKQFYELDNEKDISFGFDMEDKS